MSASLERRVSTLEQLRLDHSAPCFWCECERDERTADAPCTHGGWNPIPHEAALLQLSEGRADLERGV